MRPRCPMSGSCGVVAVVKRRANDERRKTMRTGKWMCASAALAVLATVSPAHAETVDLTSGGVVVGEVRLEGADTVVVNARYPMETEVRLRRSDLTAESLYRLLERRTESGDVSGHLALGELAEKSGLRGIAVAEYRAVRALDPAQSKEMDARIGRLLSVIAEDLLRDAKSLLDSGNARAALMYLHAILERYPGSDPAKEAKALMAAAHKAAGASAEVAERTVPADDARKAADAVVKYLGKGDASLQAIEGHEDSTVSEQRSSERAVIHFEAAREAAKTLPVSSTGDKDLDARIVALRSRAKASLVQAYLTAGTVLLGRRSIPGAEDYCNRACALDPDNKENHDLHRLILDAKTTYYRRGGGARR